MYLVCSVSILTLVSKTFPFFFRKNLPIFNNYKFWARCLVSISVWGKGWVTAAVIAHPLYIPNLSHTPQLAVPYELLQFSYGKTKTCKAVLVQVTGGLGIRWKIRALVNRSGGAMERTRALELQGLELAIQAPGLTGWVILGKLLNSFEPHFSYLGNGVTITLLRLL